MYILIGDIGNTVTKICLVDSKNYRIKLVTSDSINEIEDILKDIRENIQTVT